MRNYQLIFVCLISRYNFIYEELQLNRIKKSFTKILIMYVMNFAEYAKLFKRM